MDGADVGRWRRQRRVVLAGRVGARRKVAGTVESVRYSGSLGTRTRNALPRLARPHAGHALCHQRAERRPPPFHHGLGLGRHQRRIRFVTKALGDHTATTHTRLCPGVPVTVGPYGCFTLEDDAPRQIWIGGGIGITPFIGRMEQLAQERAAGRAGPQPIVDLFHTTRDEDPAALELMRTDAEAAGITLHVLVDARDGRLNAARICAAVPDWRQASFWFCGPAGFGQALRRDLESQGLPKGRFHQELFEMR